LADPVQTLPVDRTARGRLGGGRLDLVNACPNSVLFGVVTGIPAPVQVDEFLPLAWDGALLEYGIDGTLRLASTAVNALIGVNVQFAVKSVGFEVDSRDRADIQTRFV